mmetsp:Transcript_54538/g.100943  ORF Transcript_54538/g.100943 Transcript_54538/m.100943 type:complete len:140 (-) Transcript_54538:13-432(-)
MEHLLGWNWAHPGWLWHGAQYDMEPLSSAFTPHLAPARPTLPAGFAGGEATLDQHFSDALAAERRARITDINNLRGMIEKLRADLDSSGSIRQMQLGTPPVDGLNPSSTFPVSSLPAFTDSASLGYPADSSADLYSSFL